MANSFSILFLILCFYLAVSEASDHKFRALSKLQHLTDEIAPTLLRAPLKKTKPTLYFEVTRPFDVPKKRPCSFLVLQHDFGYTYGKPPVRANYSFADSGCQLQDIGKIVLEWKAASRGRQFDRIFGIWLDGVELLRSCTAEPRLTGIVWRVEKDITKYRSLLLKNETQDFSVFLGNIIDSTYTGVYHVNVTLNFYPKEADLGKKDGTIASSPYGDDSGADLILPISNNLALNDGFWFEIDNATDIEYKEFIVPTNVYRAVLEVYVSFHENDEFWFGNAPNEYIIANNLTDTPGNGPFREVLVLLDGKVVGAIWPFTVVFTGGINPLFWRPITGIGSFDLPTYDIEITPFLGNILDGKSHKFGFKVTNSLNVWYIDANLHLWLDPVRKKTQGKLVNHESLSLDLSVISNFKKLNGKFITNAMRSISSTGWVNSSYGLITTQFAQHFGYSNRMEMKKDGNLQILNQTISFNDSVSISNSTKEFLLLKSMKNFQLGLFSDTVEQRNHSSWFIANVTLGFSQNDSRKDYFGYRIRSLENVQNADGVMVVQGNKVVRGLGTTQEDYQYNDDDKSCYFRNISSSNYTILHDEEGTSCPSRVSSSNPVHDFCHLMQGQHPWNPNCSAFMDLDQPHLF